MKGPTNKALRSLLAPFAWMLVQFLGWMQKKHWHYMTVNAKAGHKKYVVRGVLTFFFFYFWQKFFPGTRGIRAEPSANATGQVAPGEGVKWG
jgi:hypothetical protein